MDGLFRGDVFFALRRSEWRVSPADPEEVADHLRRAEEPHLAAIATAVAARLRGDEGALHPDACIYLSIRVLTVSEFASLHLGEGRKELFDPIPLPAEEAALWLLTEWWDERGHLHAARWLTAWSDPIPPDDDSTGD